MAIEKKPYALSRNYTNQVALGIGNMRVEGTTVYFTILDTGEEVGVTLPTPADGASITEVDVDENNYLICTLSNGSTVKSTNPINVVIEVVSDGVQADFEQTDSTADDFIKNKPKFKVITEDDIDELVGVSEGEIEFVLPEEVGQWMTEHEAYAETLNEAIQKNATDIANNASDISEINTTLKNKANSDDVYNKEQVYSKEQTDNVITTKVAEIVADAPEEFNTLKEMSDWLTEHEDSAATMNTAILKNKEDIAANTEAIEENTADIANNKSDILSVNNDIEINSLTLGTKVAKNLFNKDGQINVRYNGVIESNEGKMNTVNNNIVTFNTSTSTDKGTGQIIKGLKNKKVIISCECVSVGTSSSNKGKLIIYKLNSGTELAYAFIELGDFVFEYDCGDNDELLFAFAVNGSGAGLQLKNIMIRSAEFVNPMYVPYSTPILSLQDQINTNKSNILAVKNDIAVNRTMLGTQKKNLLSVSEGSATRLFEKTINQIEPGNYILSFGEVISTDTDKNECLCFFSDSYNVQKSNAISLKRGTNISVPVTINEPVTKIRVYASNDWNNSADDTITVSNAMLRYADITDDTYEAYKPSIDTRLTDVENNLISNNNDTALASSTLGISSYYCKNIFDYAKWESSIKSVDKGTFEKHGDSITISANAYDAYTSQYAASHTNICKIPVKPNTKYTLSWESDNDNDGKVYIFKNASPSNGEYGNNKDEKSLNFETNSDTTFITVRLGVMYAGESITYSNIMIRESDITDNTYEPYKPSVNERLVEAESDIAENAESIEELDKNKQNFTFGYTYSSGSSTAGWYKLAQCVFTPSSENIVRDTTLYIDYLNNTSNQLNETKACILKAEVRASTGGIKGVKLTSLINNGVTADNIVLVAQHKEGVATAELWTKISSTYSGWRATIISNSERAANHNYGDEGFWILGKTQYRYDSYSDYSYKAFPTDYYGDIIKDLSDRITALENK
jgi:hypothetical protein